MNSRERLLSALQRKPVDRIPWAPLIDGYYLGAKDPTLNIVDAIRQFGGDVLERHVPTYCTVGDGSKVIPSRMGSNNQIMSSLRSVDCFEDIEIITEESNGYGRRKIITPLGVLNEQWYRNQTSPYFPFITEHKIKTIKDF